MQISPFQSGGGPNGVGGITVEGTPTGLKMETDKKGITRLSMNVTGNGISAQVTVTLSPSDNRATATIIPKFQFSQCYIGRATGSVQGKFRI